jgi:hypothetical protein
MKLRVPRVVRGWKYANFVTPCTNFVANSVGNGRKFCIQDDAPYWENAFAEFGLNPECVEPLFKNMTGNHFADGAFVHPHTDPAPEGYVHTRCNLMLRKPEQGGNPVLDGEEFEVSEGDLWLCLASLEVHSSTPIFGGERLIFSFGGLTALEQVKKILL